MQTLVGLRAVDYGPVFQLKSYATRDNFQNKIFPIKSQWRIPNLIAIYTISTNRFVHRI